MVVVHAPALALPAVVPAPVTAADPALPAVTAAPLVVRTVTTERTMRGVMNVTRGVKNVSNPTVLLMVTTTSVAMVLVMLRETARMTMSAAVLPALTVVAMTMTAAPLLVPLLVLNKL
jgi:hypothetical protein